MRLFKFNLFILMAMLSFEANSFTANECLNGNFQVAIAHQGKPFGLSKVNLKIGKDDCTINIYHERFKYLKQSWSVDVCREPVHIKKNGGSDVLKKVGNCTEKSSDEFCSNKLKMMAVIQDDGLIFAEGEKEKIVTDHGKSYCAYLLLKTYLGDSIVFNRGQDYSGLFSGKQMTQSAPVSSSNPASEKTAVPRPILEGEEVTPVDTESSKDKEVEEKKDSKGLGTF